MSIPENLSDSTVSKLNQLLGRAFRGEASKEEIDAFFNQSTRSLHQYMESRPLPLMAFLGMRWVLQSKLVHPSTTIPKELYEEIRRNPHHLGLWLERENLGLSMIFEALRVSKPCLELAPGEEFPEEPITDLLMCHRFGRYMKDLIGLDSQQLARIRERREWVIKEHDLVFEAELEQANREPVENQFAERALSLEGFLDRAQSLIDPLFFRVHRVAFSDLLRLGAFFLRLAAIELRQTIIWPRKPTLLRRIGIEAERVYNEWPFLQAQHFTRQWCRSRLPRLVRFLSLWNTEVKERNDDFTVYDCLETRLDFPFVGFDLNHEPCVIIDPIFAAMKLHSLQDWIERDSSLSKAAKGKKRLLRQRDRWIKHLEKKDQGDWKRGLLDRIGFEWVLVGPFKLENAGHSIGDVDILALLNQQGKRILFLGEVKRRRSPFFPRAQLHAWDFIEDAYGQSERLCRVLRESTEVLSQLQQRTGKDLSGINHFEPMIMTPNIQHVREGLLVLSAQDAPQTALTKIRRVLQSVQQL